MSDAAQAALWCALLVSGLGAAIVVHRLGLPRTYVRDLLHVGAGLWILGWPHWHGAVAPVTIVGVVAVATAAVPWISRRVRIAARLRDAVADEDERWEGLERYTLAVLFLTLVAMAFDPFPAAAGVAALALGDGVGGAIGRRFGRHFYFAPGGKRKSLEGSVAVAVMATIGVGVAAAWFGADVTAGHVVAAGVVAAFAEALAPAATDNLYVPLTVWLALLLH
jgi:dolichol kinase